MTSSDDTFELREGQVPYGAADQGYSTDPVIISIDFVAWIELLSAVLNLYFKGSGSSLSDPFQKCCYNESKAALESVHP